MVAESISSFLRLVHHILVRPEYGVVSIISSISSGRFDRRSRPVLSSRSRTVFIWVGQKFTSGASGIFTSPLLGILTAITCLRFFAECAGPKASFCKKSGFRVPSKSYKKRT